MWRVGVAAEDLSLSDSAEVEEIPAGFTVASLSPNTELCVIPALESVLQFPAPKPTCPLIKLAITCFFKQRLVDSNQIR